MYYSEKGYPIKCLPIALLIASGFLIISPGCDSVKNDPMASAGASFLLPSEPSDAKTPTAVKGLFVTSAETADAAPAEEAVTTEAVTTEDGSAEDETSSSEPSSPSELVNVVVAGRIDAGDLEPFEKGKASFILSELPDQEHTKGDPDHASDCPFCKRRLQNAPKVVVQFLGSDGKLLGKDARDLFGVNKGDEVVVVGTANYQESINMIQLDASGIYRR